MSRSENQPLEAALQKIEKLIMEKHGTKERFCYETEALQKSTLNRLLRERQDCRFSTLKSICDGLGVKLEINIRS